MRSFSYSFDGQEVHIDVKNADGQLEFTAHFPTHVGARAHWTNDMNWHCTRLNLPAFTEEDFAAGQIVIDSMPE